jgi:homoserine dehydrogenase
MITRTGETSSVSSNVVVLKLGSSVLRDENDLSRAVHEIYRHWRNGSRVVAVVSAFGDTTNRLLQLAKSVSPESEHPAIATLVGTGETTSSALLTLALHRAGIPAKLLDPAQIGLRTIGDEFNSEPIGVDADRICTELQHAVVVLPGFLGRNAAGDTTLLGRGGSDFSAVFLAHQLQGRCVLIKDVDGLYSSDPAKTEPGSLLRFRHARYATALHVGGEIVQPKAVRFATEAGLPLEITAIGSAYGTVIGDGVDTVENSPARPRPLRVALLGCGVVGGGVYERLTALPDFFEIVGVAVRDTSRLRNPQVPKSLLTTEADPIVRRDCDVVVELIGGTKHALPLIKCALHRQRHVVTANKAVMARDRDELQNLALENGVSIRASAAVGGAVPASELIKYVRSKGPIVGFSGVLNGTTNFVIDQLAQGDELDDAISAAQQAGYVEADPSLDLNGTDAAQKLVLLARAAFGVSLPLSSIERQGIEHVTIDTLAGARSRGLTIRLLATCQRIGDKIHARVAPVEVPISSLFGKLKSAQNALLVETTNRESWSVSGSGAGRWPTAEAVIADLFDLYRELSVAESAPAELEEVVA